VCKSGLPKYCKEHAALKTKPMRIRKKHKPLERQLQYKIRNYKNTNQCWENGKRKGIG